MFLRHFHKLVPNVNKRNPLRKVQLQTFLNNQSGILYLTKTIATKVSKRTFTSDEALEKSSEVEYRRQYFLRYLLNNSNKYSVFNLENIDREGVTKFKSLTLIQDFFNKPEEAEFPEDLEECFLHEVEDYSSEEICKFIILISDHKSNPNAMKLLYNFDIKLRERRFSNDEILKILFVVKEKWPNLLNHLQVKFFSRSLNKLCHKSNRLKPHQLVQLFYCLIKFQHEILRDIKFPLQNNVFNAVEELNADELGIIADGFLKSGLDFTHQSLAIAITNKTIEVLDNIQNPPIFKICKLFEEKLRMKHAAALLNFQQSIIPHVPKFYEETLIQLALTGFNMKCMHPELWNILADNFKKNIDNLNLGQIQRLVTGLVAYNIHDDELLNLAVKKFEAEVEFPKDFRVLINFLCNLVHYNLYPENLLSLILFKNVVSQCNPEHFSFNMKYKYFFINCCIDLDKPAHNVKLLDAESWKNFFHEIEMYLHHKERDRKFYTSLRRAIRVLEDLYGKTLVCESNCLPHFGPGIVMSFDKDLKALPVESFGDKQCFPKPALNDGNFWLFIMILNTNQFLYGTQTAFLPMQTRMRQLKVLGYNSVVIKKSVWLNHVKQETESEFLKNIINKTLEEIVPGTKEQPLLNT